MKMSAYSAPGIVTIDRLIILHVNKILGIDIEEKTRKRPVVEGRQIAMYLIRKETTLTLEAIGDIFGKDHATVVHAINTVNNAIEVDKSYRDKYQELISFTK